jgi:acetyl-CoA carboxylase biotin carboxyl carrier protein
MSGELPLTPEDVAEIVAVLDGTAYETLELRTARFSLKVARSGEGWTQEWDYPTAAVAAQPSASPEVENRGAEVDASNVGEGVAVVAPLPGTFYRAPQPGAPPFVEVGDEVGPGTVVGIIETMKLMNPVHAGTTGRIAAIYAENATMVEADGTLMRVVAEQA